MSEAIQGMTALQRRFAAISGPDANHKMLGLLGFQAVAEAKAVLDPHDKTRNLDRSIRLGTVTPEKAEIVAGGIGGVGYARFVEYDTKPHDIRPKRGRALRFARNASDRRLSGSARVGTTDFVFAQVVHHPGTKGVHYLQKGAENAVSKSGLRNIVVAAWNKAS